MISGLSASELLPSPNPPVSTWPIVWPTAEPMATPAAVVAICTIRPSCFGVEAPTAEAGTGARVADAGADAFMFGTRLAGGAPWDIAATPRHGSGEQATGRPLNVTQHLSGMMAWKGISGDKQAQTSCS